jgi:hypothetical protein
MAALGHKWIDVVIPDEEFLAAPRAGKPKRGIEKKCIRQGADEQRHPCKLNAATGTH